MASTGNEMGELPAEVQLEEEAPAEAPVKRAKEAPKLTKITYETREHEVAAFDIKLKSAKIIGTFDYNRRRIVWKVPVELAEEFDTHFHVRMQRVIKVS